MKIDLDDAWIELRGQKNEDGKQAKIKLNSSIKKNDDGSNLPYFEVVSELGNHLIHIGNTHYIKTDVFEPTNFIFRDNQNNVQGQGMKIDLTGNQINASNFTLSSNNIYLNSTEVTKSEDNKDVVRYLVIKDNKTLADNGDITKNQKILMYVASDGFYLKSATYKETSATEIGDGMKLDLTNGKIDAYNFALTSDKVILTTTGSELQPYLLVKGNNGKAIIQIDNTNQYIRSSNYDDTEGSEAGMFINLSGGSITGYDFDLKAGNSSTGYIKISSSASVPLWVGSDSDDENSPYFKVDWAGNLYAKGATINGTIHASGGTFNGKITATEGSIGGWKINSNSLSTADGTTMVLNSGGSITIKDTNTFHVTNQGHLTCSSATIGGWDVKESSTGGSGFSYSGVGQMLSSGFSYGGNGVGSPFYVDAEGNLYATSATFDESLTVKSSRNGDIVFLVDSSGNLAIHGKLYAEEIGSATYIYFGGTTAGSAGVIVEGTDFCAYTNNVWLGNTNSTTDKICVNGNLYVNNNVYYSGDIYCASDGAAGDNKGVDGSITYASGGLFGGKKQTLTFKKGILVKASDAVSDDGGDSTIPSPAGKAGKLLGSDGSKLVWKDIGISVKAVGKTLSVSPSGYNNVYDIDIPYEKTATVDTTQYVGFSIPSGGGRVTLYECSSSQIGNYECWGVVYSSGSKTVTGTASG